ncbi:unnamed protein product [Prunus armeniaca]
MHREELKLLDRRLLNNEGLLEKCHILTFSEWLKNKVKFGNTGGMSTTVKWLACRPMRDVMSYSGYVINGHRFHTRNVNRSTQDSGVSMEANTICQSSAEDTSQAIGKITYYGVIRYIVLLDYRMFKVPVFDCDWANITNGVKVGDGFTLINLHQGLHQFRKDPFILAYLAKQVFYSRTDNNSNWVPSEKKKQHATILAAAILRERKMRAIRISDGVAAANPSTEGINVSSKGKGKVDEENRKPRGRARLQYLSKGNKLLVEFNPRGQTHGENAAKFASLLGAIHYKKKIRRGGAASWFWSGCIHMFLEPSRTLQLLRRLRAFWSLGMSVTPRLKPEVASSFNGKLNLLVNDVETNIRNPTAECTLMNILHSWLLT